LLNAGHTLPVGPAPEVVTALASSLLMIKPQFRGIDSLMIKWFSRCKI